MPESLRLCPWQRSLLLLGLTFFALSSCANPAGRETPTSPSSASRLILATTTSTQDSGLLDVLIPLFEQQTGYTVQVVAVGSGQALKMGEDGNADVLLVHAPALESSFMEKGYGKERLLVMHNDFILVGPPNDPAHISGLSSVEEAFKKIAAVQAAFISRGDESGTHQTELQIWHNAGIRPLASDWYLESGQGMGATLQIASEKGAYALTDRATFLAMRASLHLKALIEGSPSLFNIYHVITVNPQRFPTVNAEGAQAFASFLVSPAAQEIIGQFGLEAYGQSLFTPDAGKSEAELQ